MKRLTRSQKRDLADRLFSLYIRARDGHCRRCGQDFDLQCAHLTSRTYHATRFDEDGAVALCRGCHLWFDHHPIEKRRLAREWIGDEAYEALEHRGAAYGKVDYDAVLNWLRAEVA